MINLFLPAITHAQSLGLENASGVELTQKGLSGIITDIINYSLVLVGVIAVAMLVYGGFLYITAAGDTSQIDKAKKVLIYAVIGIVVIGVAAAVVNFVIGGVSGF